MKAVTKGVSVARFGASLMTWLLLTLAGPASATPIDLSQLCGSGDCVVSSDKTITSASGPLNVNGNFTIEAGVVVEFLVPIHLKVAGDMVLSGTIGAPGNGGDGGAGGGPGQPGGAGGSAPAVASAIFDVRGAVTLNGSGAAVAVADGGAGGSGGMPGAGQSAGGSGGTGGAAGSFTFNTCDVFKSESTARILVNGGPGGVGQTGAAGGVGGAGGAIFVNARSIVSNGPIGALCGSGGAGGSSAGADGQVGSVSFRATGPISVGAGTLDSGVRTSVEPFRLSIPAIAFCPAAVAQPVPGLSSWLTLLLASLITLCSIPWLRRRLGV